MLHCVKQVQTAGGDNQFADTYHATAIFKDRHPEDYALLTKYSLEYVDIGVDYTKYNLVKRRPCIRFHLFVRNII